MAAAAADLDATVGVSHELVQFSQGGGARSLLAIGRHARKELSMLFLLAGDGSRLAGLLETKKPFKPNGHRGKVV